MQIPICSGFYEHSSKDVNNQRCLNIFPSVQGPTPRGAPGEQYALIPTPGLTSLVDTGGDVVRALIPFGDQLFAVVDSTLYEVTVDFTEPSATVVSKGTLLGGNFLSWAKNSTQIFISEGNAGASIYTPSTSTLTQITDPDFQLAETVTFMDGYFIYNVPNTGQMASTAVGDGADIDALDIATAEGSPDNLVAVVSDKRELWALGETSTEIWWNAANATGFPFTRREGAYIDIGCGASCSAITINNTIMWLDNRRYLVMTRGYGLEIVSTPAVSAEFASYEDVSNAFAYEHRYRGHLFYVITFPNDKKTWAYDLTTQLWHERQSWDSSINANVQHLAKGKATYQGRELIGGRTGGKIYLMSDATYTEDGATTFRTRVTPFVHDEFRFVSIDSLELNMETGSAPVTGAGSDPMITLRYSNNGGYTWSYAQTRSLGKTGNYLKPIRWNRLGTAREWLFEFNISDPISFAITDASVDVTVEVV